MRDPIRHIRLKSNRHRKRLLKNIMCTSNLEVLKELVFGNRFTHFPKLTHKQIQTCLICSIYHKTYGNQLRIADWLLENVSAIDSNILALCIYEVALYRDTGPGLKFYEKWINSDVFAEVSFYVDFYRCIVLQSDFESIFAIVSKHKSYDPTVFNILDYDIYHKNTRKNVEFLIRCGVINCDSFDSFRTPGLFVVLFNESKQFFTRKRIIDYILLTDFEFVLKKDSTWVEIKTICDIDSISHLIDGAVLFEMRRISWPDKTCLYIWQDKHFSC